MTLHPAEADREVSKLLKCVPQNLLEEAFFDPITVTPPMAFLALFRLGAPNIQQKIRQNLAPFLKKDFNDVIFLDLQLEEILKLFDGALDLDSSPLHVIPKVAQAIVYSAQAKTPIEKEAVEPFLADIRVLPPLLVAKLYIQGSMDLRALIEGKIEEYLSNKHKAAAAGLAEKIPPAFILKLFETVIRKNPDAVADLAGCSIKAHLKGPALNDDDVVHALALLHTIFMKHRSCFAAVMRHVEQLPYQAIERSTLVPGQKDKCWALWVRLSGLDIAGCLAQEPLKKQDILTAATLLKQVETLHPKLVLEAARVVVIPFISALEKSQLTSEQRSLFQTAIAQYILLALPDALRAGAPKNMDVQFAFAVLNVVQGKWPTVLPVILQKLEELPAQALERCTLEQSEKGPLREKWAAFQSALQTSHIDEEEVT